jgi:uncharacterized protein YhaN
MIEVLRQARNAFVWNLNTDLDNIPACDQWAKMLRKNIDDLDKAIAKLEQHTEPPDWFPAVENILNEYGLQAMDFVADFKAAMKDAEQSQRTWVGLTDEEEILAISNTMPYADRFEFAKAIEAKLKEKNT